jgi:hypothetical protein
MHRRIEKAALAADCIDDPATVRSPSNAKTSSPSLLGAVRPSYYMHM